METIREFPRRYRKTVQKIMSNLQRVLTRTVFNKNVSILMPSFGMSRVGPFKGVKYTGGSVVDPSRIIAKCWRTIGNDTIQLRNFLNGQTVSKREPHSFSSNTSREIG